MRKDKSTLFTNCVLERRYDSVQLACVLTKTELLRALDAKGVQNKDVGRVLDLPSSRVSEIFRAINGKGGKPRELTYDEGVKLTLAFGLESSPQVQALPASILRLAVRHVALSLQAEATEAQIEGLAEDLRAFSEYATDPKVRRSVEAAEGFFQALQRRHPANDIEAPPETDPGTSSRAR